MLTILQIYQRSIQRHIHRFRIVCNALSIEVFPLAQSLFAIQPYHTLILGLADELTRTFDKVNSNRTYQLGKDPDDNVTLMVNITKGKKPGITLCRNTRSDITFMFKENTWYLQKIKKLIWWFHVCFKKQKVLVEYWRHQSAMDI